MSSSAYSNTGPKNHQQVWQPFWKKPGLNTKNQNPIKPTVAA